MVSVQVGGNVYFYPRSPCGERRWLRCWQLAARDISIHALLAESDLIALFDFPIVPAISIHALLAESDSLAPKPKTKATEFLSTLSLRRATAHNFTTLDNIFISIHALLAESDSRTETVATKISHFYPRSPCGERPSQEICRP